MALKDEQLHRLADTALRVLVERGGTTLKAERGRVLARIAAILAADREVEAELDRQAEKLLAQHSAGSGAELDRRKLFAMIKKKLADEKGYPL